MLTVVSATASRSQLLKAYTNSTGDRATIAVSQGRRPVSGSTARTVTSAHTASRSEVTTV
jgi:hypothetical protein